MKPLFIAAAIALICFAFVGARATDSGILPESVSSVVLPELINVDHFVSSSPTSSKAETDSLYLLGGPGVLSGKFQTLDGLPDRQGWIGVDHTQETEMFWQVSTFNAAELDTETVENHAWWCGDYFESCNEGDPAEGYGNNWFQYLDWYGTVSDPGSNVTVRVQAAISYDIEPGEEYLHLQVNNSEFMENLDTVTYRATAEIVDITTILTPDYFVGETGDQVHLRWAFTSDGGWSDEDCNWPTAGAAQIDLIQVSFDQGSGPVQIGTIETCEAGDSLQWQPSLPGGVGDFSKVWPQLDDADPDADNNSPQFAFIDDGLVVPGTGGFPCTTYCYGPGGFIVSPVGGISDLYVFINNEILSPIITVPAGDWNAAVFSFDQYVHAELYSGAPYIFGTWHVRSTSDPAGLTGWSPWRNNNIALWGDPRYVRNIENITNLLEPGFTHVQLALGVVDYHYTTSTDGSPAPYYDNVSLKVYKNLEPSALLVRPDGSGDYPTIQVAINAAAEHDTVLLADGIYTGGGNRDLYFLGKDVVVASQSGNPENCIIDAQGAPGDTHRGFHFSYKEGPGCVITGLTITGGFQNLTSSSFTYSGGAIICKALSSPTITNCIFLGNSALGTDQQGGAIYCDDASPLISNCVFEGNVAARGGAIGVNDVSSPVISNCLFVGNEALRFGGAVYAYEQEASVTISSCTFQGNIYPTNTGTLASISNAHFDIDHSIVANGSAYSVMVTAAADLQITCSNIYGNPSGDWFGQFSDQLGINGNTNLDPLFCLDDNPGQPYGLDEDSPCSPEFNPECGLVGCLPVACGSTSSVEDDMTPDLLLTDLSCHPNPFNPGTTIVFSLAVSGPAELRIYGLDGRLVKTLVNEVISAGTHEIIWDGQDDQGRTVASGLFFGRLKTGDKTKSIRMVLLK